MCRGLTSQRYGRGIEPWFSTPRKHEIVRGVVHQEIESLRTSEVLSQSILPEEASHDNFPGKHSETNCASTCGLRDSSGQSIGLGKYVLGAVCRKRVCTWKLKTAEGEGGHRQTYVCTYLGIYYAQAITRSALDSSAGTRQKSLRSRLYRDLPQSMQRWRRVRSRFTTRAM
jgi:hypothetical protein